jgi:hypothetical protein
MESDGDLLFAAVCLQARRIDPDQFAAVVSESRNGKLADKLVDRGWVSVKAT